jgi:hypothetical protein
MYDHDGNGHIINGQSIELSRGMSDGSKKHDLETGLVT